MQTKKLVLTSVAVAAAIGLAGYALAQGPHGPGHDMPMRMQMGPGMHAMMHGGPMHGGPHAGPARGPGGPHHAQPQTAAVGDQSAASLAFRAVNEKMHRDMAIAFTGDADADFVRGMIPHHQGAIDMAKIVLAFGKDAEIKKLAEEVVKAQEGEIAQMRAWLTKRGR